MSVYPEHESVEAFVEFCIDDERGHFTTADLQALNQGTQERLSDLRRELEGYGLRFAPRAFRRRVRGFTSNPHDRWYGRGADRTYGGSGHEQIQGWAGTEG